MADPLSVTASILAIVGAADKALNGLDKLWQLRHRDQQFLDLRNQSTGIRIQIRAINSCLPAIERCEASTGMFADTLSDIKAQSIQATALLGNLDVAIQDMIRKSEDTRRSILLKPSKRIWLKRQSETARLMSQVNTVIQPLTTTLTLLQTHLAYILPRNVSSSSTFVIQDIAILDQGCDNLLPSAEGEPIENQLEVAVHTLQELDLNKLAVSSGQESPEPEVISTNDSTHATNSPDTSPAVSFHTARSRKSSIMSKLLTITGTLASEQCKRFCPCQCHIPRQVRPPLWAEKFIGSMSFAGNGSPLLNRRPCDKTFCGRSGTTSMQFTYVAPAWAFLKSFIVEGKAQGLHGWNSSWSIRMPRVIDWVDNIWWCVERGRISQVRQAFARKWNSPFDTDSEGYSLIHHAANKNQFDMYRFLLSQGSRSNLRDVYGTMPTHILTEKFVFGLLSNEEMNLIDEDHLDDQGFTLLHRIVLGLHGMDLSMYLNDISLDLDTPDAGGKTALYWAAYLGNPETVDLLLNAGAAVDEADRTGVTPLMIAATGGTYSHLRCVQRLLSADASIEESNVDGWTATHCACNGFPASLDILYELVRYGADIHHESNDGGHPLYLAAGYEDTDMVDFVVSLGVDINEKTRTGSTPAMYAVYQESWANFYHLVELGADLSLADNNGHTVLHSAVYYAPVDIWEYLEELAEMGRLAAVDTDVEHNGHDIWGCFSDCRDRLYNGVRDVDEEKESLQAVLEAIWKSQSNRPSDQI